MRKVAIAITLTLLLVGACSASVVTAQASIPTSAQLAWARSKAVAYWHVAQPPCGRERVLSLPLALATDGQTSPETCIIELNSHLNLRGFPVELCAIYVHEYGHLVLSPDFFAASDPSDPAHSSDPNNIMYGGVGTPQQEEHQDITSGCLKPHHGNTY
jgi:hypothetical protein